jgi:3-dehydroquinate synthase
VSTVTSPVVVTHGLGSYPVYVAPGAMADLAAIVLRHLPERRVVMLADATVLQLFRSGDLGPTQWTGDTLTVPAGEQSKTRETWARLTDDLLERGYGRDTGIIALGGGVTGDLAGFVAATYMRGLPYVQVPTTLLAMLDASVGGKTGVDTAKGKNLVGSFHPPVAVVADPLNLRSLAARDYRAGLAEAVKHGLIADRSYFEWMEAHVSELIRREPTALTTLVRRSVEIKAEVVSEDEREGGRRAILNAGHTVAHALEQVTNYTVRHGEAVALGLVLECELAEQLGLADSGLCRRVGELLTRLGLPDQIPVEVDPAALVESMRGDKKNRGGQIHFSLPATLGRMHGTDGWTTAVPDQAIERFLTGSNRVS